MKSQSKAKPSKSQKTPTINPQSANRPHDGDDFISVARRLGADENKERFEAKLKKIAKAKPEVKR
jgi:hypothetical protein